MDDSDGKKSHGGWLGGVLPLALAVCVVAVLWRVSGARPYRAVDPAWNVMTAIDNDDLRSVRRALDRGMPVEARECGTTPLLRAAELGRVPIIELLLSRGADTRASDDFGTPLAYATWNRAGVDTVRLLLRHRADPGVGRPNGVTPLMLATMVDDVESMDALIAAGAALDARDRGGVLALDVARTEGFVDAERLLLNAAARQRTACGVASAEK
jgi:hypothetical protein